MSPFDITTSITKTKEDLSIDPLFEKDYAPFIVNRILSMSPQTVIFASEMNMYSNLDKNMQYKFYLNGIPKSSKYSKYIKKEELQINKDHIDFICSYMNLNISRAIEVYSIIGSDKVQTMIDSRGGRK